MQSETAIGRKIDRLKIEIGLLRQVIRAYEDLVANPQDHTAGIALGTALAALKHHDANTETGRRLEAHLEELESLPVYDLAGDDRGTP